MGKALYRKYRSKKLSEIVGQEHVTTALSNALKNGRIGHAYLFTGPRGVGKTSIARILAHAVNDLPYNEAANHLDIIEIDAASNRRIDEIRSLREKVHNAPTSAKYKVYIIDEVHMLTKEAFNALLKTLEEPPEHVIFILATTEAHKLPETIISRTQRYSFKPAEKDAASSHLAKIAKAEGFDISQEALQLLAEHGNGSFRDSISLLDQVSNTNGKIQLEDVQRALGIAPQESITQLLSAVSSGTAGELIDILTSLREQGYQAPQIARQLNSTIRQGLLDESIALDTTATTELMKKLIGVPAAHDPAALLEIILLDPVLARRPAATRTTTPPAKPKNIKTEPETATEKPQPKASTNNEPPAKAEQEGTQEATPEATSKEPEPKLEKNGVLDETSWQQVLHALKQQYNTLYGIARMASPIFDNGTLTLSFRFPFHQKRFSEPKNKQILRDIISKQLNLDVEIACITDKGAKAPPATSKSAPTPKTNNPLDTISNIFGGAEVLE